MNAVSPTDRVFEQSRNALEDESEDREELILIILLLIID